LKRDSKALSKKPILFPDSFGPSDLRTKEKLFPENKAISPTPSQETLVPSDITPTVTVSNNESKYPPPHEEILDIQISQTSLPSGEETVTVTTHPSPPTSEKIVNTQTPQPSPLSGKGTFTVTTHSSPSAESVTSPK